MAVVTRGTDRRHRDWEPFGTWFIRHADRGAQCRTCGLTSRGRGSPGLADAVYQVNADGDLRVICHVDLFHLRWLGCQGNSGTANATLLGMSEAPPPSAADQPSVVRLAPASKAWRIVITVLVLSITMYGTLWGTDSDFPFAPFRMFANADPVNKPVKSTRLEGITENGDRIVVRGADVGMRRAEFEGQLPRFRKDRDLMAALARAYERRNPNRPDLVQIDVVVREFELKEGKPTKEYHDRVVLTWKRDGTQ